MDGGDIVYDPMVRHPLAVPRRSLLLHVMEHMVGEKQTLQYGAASRCWAHAWKMCQRHVFLLELGIGLLYHEPRGFRTLTADSDFDWHEAGEQLDRRTLTVFSFNPYPHINVDSSEE